MDDIFKKAAQNKEALEKEFDEAPETIITGVVGASGPGGGRIPPDELWHLHLSLVAWKANNGELEKRDLMVSKGVTEKELAELQERIKSESIIKFKGKLSKESPFGDSRARLIELMGEPKDKELDDALIAYKQPVVKNHPLFGELLLDKTVDWFEGKANWLGSEIKIYLSLDEDGDSEGSIDTATKVFSECAEWSKKVNKYAVAELLELKNESWLQENQTELSPIEFLKAMSLESITFNPDGNFEFWHNDGGLFWGHSILICGSIEEGLYDADIPG